MPRTRTYGSTMSSWWLKVPTSSRPLIAAAVIVAAVSMSSCSSADPDPLRVTAATESPEERSAPGRGDMISDLASIGINALVSFSHAGIVGEVTSVGASRWNSTDGKEWEGNLDPMGRVISAIPFRNITVRVDRVLFDSDRLRVKPSDELVIRAHLGYPGSGTFEHGSTVLVLLARSGMPFEDGHADEAIEVFGAFDGSWRRQGDEARSTHPGRNAPFDALVSRILEERHVGRNPDRDPGTETNPLAQPRRPQSEPPALPEPPSDPGQPDRS